MKKLSLWAEETTQKNENEITLQSCVPITDTIPDDGGGVGGHPPYLPQKAMAGRGC